MGSQVRSVVVKVSAAVSEYVRDFRQVVDVTEQAAAVSKKSAAQFERASSQASAAARREADAAGQLRTAQTRLAEARGKSSASASQVVAAEERVAKAERAHVAAADEAAAASKRLASANAATVESSTVAATKYRRFNDTVDTGTSKMDSKLTGFTKSTLALGGVFAGFEAAHFAGESVKTALDYQRTTQVLITAAGEAHSNLDMIRAGIRGVSNTTGTSLDQLSEGMYMVEKAGYRGSAGLHVLMAAAKGAKDENADLGVVTHALTSIMQTSNGAITSPAKAMNALMVAAGHSKTTMQEYAGALANVLPVSAKLGITFDQTSGALSAMTAQGMSARRASMELNHAIIALAAPNGVQSDWMDAFGLDSATIRDNLGKKGLQGTIEELSQTVRGQMASSAKVLHADLGKLPADAQAVVKQFQNGTMTLTQYGKAIDKTKGVTAAQKAEMFAMVPALSGYQQAMKNITGGQVGLQVAMMLTGRTAKQFTDTTRDVGKAMNSTADFDEKWGLTSHSTANELAIAKARVENLGSAVATTLLPAIGKVAGKVATATMNVDKFVQGNKGWIGPLVKDLGKVALAYAAVKTASKVVSKLPGLAGGATEAAVGGSALSKAVGNRVFVTNWPPGMLVPTGSPTGLPVTPVAPAAAAASGGLLSGVASAIEGGIAGSVIGKAAPNLFKVWEDFQTKAKISAVLSKAKPFSPPAWMVAGGGGMKTSKPGQSLGGGTLLTADNVTPKELASLSAAEKKTLGLKDAIVATKKAGPGALTKFVESAGKAGDTAAKIPKMLKTIPKDLRLYVSTPGVITSIKDMGRLAQAYHLTPKQIKTIMQLQGFTAAEAGAASVGKAFYRLPKKVQTAVLADTVKSRFDVANLQRQYHLTPAEVRTLFKATGVDTVRQAAAEARAALANVPKTVFVDIRGRNHVSYGGGPVNGLHVPKADGGTVPGQRNPYGDKTHILAAPGEEIITNRHGEADQFRRDRASGRIPAYADGGTVGTSAVSGGTGTPSVTVVFPDPAVYKAAVTAADQIAISAADTARSAKDTRQAHLDDLHQQQQIRDLTKQLDEHNKKTVGKGKNRHQVKGGFTLTGLDRTTAKAELADAKATLTEMRKITDAETQALQEQQQARSDATSSITGGLDIFAHGIGGSANYVQRFAADAAKAGTVMAQLRAKKVSPILLQQLLTMAQNGDFRGVTRAGQALLDQPALLAQLDTSLSSFGQVAGSLATLTTDPRFLGTGSWNPAGQVASTRVDVQLGVDPSTWTTDITRRVTANVLAAINGGG